MGRWGLGRGEKGLKHILCRPCFCLIRNASQQLLSSVLTVALSGKCDEEILHLLLTFPESEKSWFATRELCSLPGSQVFSLLVVMGQNLNLRNFIYKVRTKPLGGGALQGGCSYDCADHTLTVVCFLRPQTQGCLVPCILVRFLSLWSVPWPETI